MAPSALYRYFNGRDALLSALILTAYESLADEAERAADERQASGDADIERWPAVPRALREWALARPHEWGLIFGTPVPGYEAPRDTVVPYARVAAAMMRPVVDAAAAGRLPTDDDVAADVATVPEALRAAVAPVAEGLLPELPVATVVRAIQAWTTIVGLISLEVFGHWRNTILDPGQLFDATVRDVAGAIGLH
jgi:AcrR family transcriptional regulator